MLPTKNRHAFDAIGLAGPMTLRIGNLKESLISGVDIFIMTSTVDTT